MTIVRHLAARRRLSWPFFLLLALDKLLIALIYMYTQFTVSSLEICNKNTTLGFSVLCF